MYVAINFYFETLCKRKGFFYSHFAAADRQHEDGLRRNKAVSDFRSIIKSLAKKRYGASAFFTVPTY